MNAGMPGAGIGVAYYLLLIFTIPFRRKQKTHLQILSLFLLAGLILAGLWLSDLLSALWTTGKHLPFIFGTSFIIALAIKLVDFLFALFIKKSAGTTSYRLCNSTFRSRFLSEPPHDALGTPVWQKTISRPGQK